MNSDAERIAEEFDRICLEPATERLRAEDQRLEVLEREMEDVLAKKRALAVRMRALISDIEAERDALSATLRHYHAEIAAVSKSVTPVAPA